MKLRIIAFGIAKDILKARELEVDEAGLKSIGDVKRHLISNYPEFSKLASLRFAVDEEYREDTFLLTGFQEIVIIPPVAGG